MGKSKKRKQGDFADGNDGVRDFGLGQTISQMKRRRVSEDAQTLSGSSPEESLNVVLARQNVDRAAEGGEWQTVSAKKRKQKGQVKESTYPELVFHTKQQVPIRIQDLQNLVLYTLADGVAPSWLAFKNARQTKKVVVLMVPGLEKEMLEGKWNFDETCATGNGHAPSEVSGLRRNGDALRAISIADRDPSLEQDQAHFNAWKAGGTTKHPPNSTGTPTTLISDDLPSSLASIGSMFSHVWPVRSPGDSRYSKVHSPLQAMLIAPISADPEDKSKKGPRPPAEEKTFKATRTPITAFIHSADELREADYPIHRAAFTSSAEADLEHERREKTGQSISAGWIDTEVTDSKPITPIPPPPSSDLSCGLNIYSLDCEMVLTSDNIYSLARISLVAFNSGHVIIDKYVKPSLPISNYFTQYSGITPALLAGVTTTLLDIQSELLALLDSSSILIGHSLESDLNALKLTHPYIIDTALIYPHPRGMPLRSSLKYLASKYLRRDIQTGSNGHDSIEDARAVLDLVRLKCEKGPKWGTSEAQGESIFRRLSRAKNSNGEPRTTAMVDYGTPERGYGKEADFKIGCAADDEVVAGVIRAVNGDDDGKGIKAGGVDFVWARLRALEFARGWNKESNSNNDAPAIDLANQAHSNGTAPDPNNTNGHGHATTSTPVDSARKVNPTTTLSALTLLSTHLSAIHASLPPCTLLLIYSGTGDPRPLAHLQKLQSIYRKEFKVKKWDDLSVKWTDDEEQALKRAADRARDGCGLFCVK